MLLLVLLGRILFEGWAPDTEAHILYSTVMMMSFIDGFI